MEITTGAEDENLVIDLAKVLHEYFSNFVEIVTQLWLNYFQLSVDNNNQINTTNEFAVDDDDEYILRLSVSEEQTNVTLFLCYHIY